MLSLEGVASPHPLTLILTFLLLLETWGLYHMAAKMAASLQRKWLEGGVEVEVKWGEVSCIYWDLELEMEVEIWVVKKTPFEYYFIR